MDKIVTAEIEKRRRSVGLSRREGWMIGAVYVGGKIVQKEVLQIVEFVSTWNFVTEYVLAGTVVWVRVERASMTSLGLPGCFHRTPEKTHQCFRQTLATAVAIGCSHWHQWTIYFHPWGNHDYLQIVVHFIWYNMVFHGMDRMQFVLDQHLKS